MQGYGRLLSVLCAVGLFGCGTPHDRDGATFSTSPGIDPELRERLRALSPKHDLDVGKTEQEVLATYGDPDAVKVTSVQRLESWLQRRLREANVSRHASIKTLHYMRPDGERYLCLAPKRGQYVVVADEFLPPGWIETIHPL